MAEQQAAGEAIEAAPDSHPDGEPAYEDPDSIREAPATQKFDSVHRASVGRAAVNRSSCKNASRRKSTLRQSNQSGGRPKGLSGRKSGPKKQSSIAPLKGANRYFREDAGVVEVLQALLIPDDGTDTDGILRCMLALERLVESDPKNGRLLKNQDQGLEIIVTLIGRYGSKDNFVSTGCWILSNVAVEEDLASAVCQAGGDRAALEVLSRSTSTEMILHAAVALLCNIALHESLRGDLVENNAIARIIHALDTYPNHEWIQFTSVQMLQNFANSGSLCEQMLKQNAIQRVVKAMHYFSDHEELLQSSNWIMSCLAFSATDEQRAELQEQFGLVAVIIQGMTDSLDHIGVQFTGCSALSNLGRNPSLLDTLATANTVHICAKGMRAHPDHDGLQMVACRCMVLLSANGHARKQFHQENCKPLCEAVLDRFPDSAAAVEAGEAVRLYGGGKCCTLL